MTGHRMQITEQTRSQIPTDMSITPAGITKQQVTGTGKRMYQEQTLIPNGGYRSTGRIPYVSADIDMQCNRYREHMYCERTLIPNMEYRSAEPIPYVSVEQKQGNICIRNELLSRTWDIGVPNGYRTSLLNRVNMKFITGVE